MMSAKKDKRPDCGELLKVQNSWAIPLKQLKNDSNFKILINSCEDFLIENSFSEYFIKSKSNYQ